MQLNQSITAMFRGLGLVANGKRIIRSGSEYDKYFNLAGGSGLWAGVENKEITLLSDGNVFETVGEMQRIVRKTLSQTQRIANTLKGTTREETARNIYNFLYSHVQYTKDNPLREQLRQPTRTWKDRKAGVDCDCYSIFISSVLINLGVPHAFRIAKYGGDWQHVYVIVPKTGKDFSSYYTIDPVVDSFDQEATATEIKDFTMKVTMLNGPVTMLNGRFGSCPPKSDAAATAAEADANALTYQMSTSQLKAMGLTSTTKLLDEAGVPYATSFDDNGAPVVQVGSKTVAGFIDTATADTTVAMLKNSLAAEVAAVDQPVVATTLSNEKKALGITAIGLMALAALANSFKSKPGVVSGLGSPASKKVALIKL